MTDDKEMKDATVQEKSETNVPTAPAIPALEAAARRLEKQLGGGVVDKHKVIHTYANPAKVVRRWLGTSSGAAGKATVADIAQAADVLLDPNGACAPGRALLVTPGGTTMDLDTTPKDSPQYLSTASSREVESWLLSLNIRILWKEKNFSEALDLAQKSISILLGHLEVASMNLTSLSGVATSSLFPLLARMYRYRSLLAEELKDPSVIAGIRRDMTTAHNMACLRRDVDCQATLLNLMLRDLLIHSQSKR
jgi:26S proteasome regulatory subunit N3